MRHTKLIIGDNEEYIIEKDQQYVIDCTFGGGELKIIEKVNKHECGMLYKNYYAIGDAIDKLAEYENMIEEGTLKNVKKSLISNDDKIETLHFLKNIMLGGLGNLSIQEKEFAIYHINNVNMIMEELESEKEND